MVDGEEDRWPAPALLPAHKRVSTSMPPPARESVWVSLPRFPATSRPHPHQLGQPFVNQHWSCSYSFSSSHGLPDLWANSRSKIDTVSLTSASPGGIDLITQLQGNPGLCTECHWDYRVATQPSGPIRQIRFFCLGDTLIQMAFSQSSK